MILSLDESRNINIFAKILSTTSDLPLPCAYALIHIGINFIHMVKNKAEALEVKKHTNSSPTCLVRFNKVRKNLVLPILPKGRS